MVGIGASAGGYQAFKQLLENLPTDTRLAFVLVQHLDPTHESQLTDLLARATKLPVVEARDGMAVEPDHIYVLAPNTSMVIEGGILRVSPRSATEANLPVDRFFRSLAEELGHRAIGVVLSGTASDGAEGVQAIKVAGGLTYAQDEISAKHPGMPRNAAATGCVDFVLEPAAIARELARIGSHWYLNGTSDEEKIEESKLAPVFRLLYTKTGVDFTQYKPETLQRRIQRRMALHRLQSPDEYIACLNDKPEEAEPLFADLLISVTGFFRDPKAFQLLKKRVFPSLTRDREKDEAIRIWVPGCSTGEEAYSLGIALLEHLRAKRQEGVPIQIFGTDINGRALEKARSGVYPPSIEKDLSRARLHRYFVGTAGSYRVANALRELCVFAQHDLIKDPPFSNVDLISCRNVLIYLGSPAQKRVLPIFHYALKPTGFLLLGKSETILSFSNLFSAVDKRQKVYSPKATAKRTLVTFRGERGSPPHATPGAGRSDMAPVERAVPDAQRAVDHLLVDRFAPPCVLVNGEMEVLQFRGRTGPFLEHEAGTANLQLFRMTRDEIANEVRAAIRKAKNEGAPVRRQGIQFVAEKNRRIIDVEVVPMRIGREREPCYLVLFEESAGSPVETEEDEKVTDAAPATRDRIADLKRELAATKASHREIVQELETANEELKALNEELQSGNEELESTNEELETSKEELQSANEELRTVNEELQARDAELVKANDDLLNVLASVNIPIVVLDADLRVRRYTPMAEKVLKLIPTDLGRSFSSLRLPLKPCGLKRMLSDVIDNLGARHCDVQDKDGRWYSLQVKPYRTSDKRIDGAVLAMWDIDATKRALQEVRAARDYSEAIVETITTPLLVLSDDLRVQTANNAFYRTFDLEKRDVAGRLINGLGDKKKKLPELSKHLKKLLRDDTSLTDVQLVEDFPGVGTRTVNLNARRVTGATRDSPSILLVIEVLTERKEMEAEILHTAEAERERIGRDLHDGLGQALPSIGYLVRAVQQSLENKNAPETEEVKKIARLVEENAQRVHDVSRGLFPAEMTKGGIAAALRELAAYSEELYGLPCRVSGSTALNLTDDRVAPQLYRMAQEAVNNAARHSKAKNIWIRLAQRQGRIVMTVRDDGSGIPRQKAGRHTGMGLRIMRYRADLIGATLKIESTKGEGTKISCNAPPRLSKKAN